MRKLSLIAALIATTLSGAAVAADWVLVSNSVAGDLTYIERESIRTMPNGYKRAWQRKVYPEPNNFGDTSVKAFGEFDCREGRSRFLQITFFKGEEVSSYDNKTTDWSYVSPGSVNERLFNFVCFGTLPE